MVITMVIDKEKYEFMVVVELDDEKILSDEKYDLEDTYRVVKKAFVDEGLIDISEGKRLTFMTKQGDSQGCASVGVVINLLWRSWAKPYLKVMEWHGFDDGTVEDVIAIFRECDKKRGG